MRLDKVKCSCSTNRSHARHGVSSGTCAGSSSNLDRSPDLLFRTLAGNERLCGLGLRNPETVEIGAQRTPAETVTHAVYPVSAEQKFDLLMALTRTNKLDSALIFSRTKLARTRSR